MSNDLGMIVFDAALGTAVVLAPAGVVSAQEVAKEAVKEKPALTLDLSAEDIAALGWGRTIGKGRVGIGLEYGTTTIDKECTGGTVIGTTGTTPADEDGLNRGYDFSTKRNAFWLVPRYGVTDWLEGRLFLGGIQSDFPNDKKASGTDPDSNSDTDLAYGAGFTLVPYQFDRYGHPLNGVYVAINGSWKQGNHDGMSVDGQEGKVDVKWQELVAQLELGKRFNIGREKGKVIVPFCGVEWAGYEEERKWRRPQGTGSNLDFRQKDPWSVYAGTELKLSPNWDAIAKGQYGGDKGAFFVGIRHNFGGRGGRKGR